MYYSYILTMEVAAVALCCSLFYPNSLG